MNQNADIYTRSSVCASSHVLVIATPLSTAGSAHVNRFQEMKNRKDMLHSPDGVGHVRPNIITIIVIQVKHEREPS